MSADQTRVSKEKPSVFRGLKLGLIAGLIFGGGYFAAKLTSTASPIEASPTKQLSENERLELAQANYEKVRKKLKLGYYEELTSKPQRAQTKRNPEPLKSPKIQREKPSSEHMAKSLAKVLGQSTPDPVSDAAQTKLPTQTGSPYAVQVASLMDRKSAEELTNKLVVKGYAARLLQAQLPDRGLVYRVRIHGFNSKEEAERARIGINSKEKIDAITVAQSGS